MRQVGHALGRLRPSTVQWFFDWFHRLVGVWCIGLGLTYWVRLIGIHGGDLWRYDLMPVHWRVAAVTLAILYPMAGSGLWMVASWGPVLWFICAATETAMYFVFPELFGYRPGIVAAHLCIALVYLAFRTVIYLQKRASA